MNFLIIIGSVAAGLFMLTFIRSGRFGVAALALGVGYLLARMWTDILVSLTSFALPYISTSDTVHAGLILLPGILALLFGHHQNSLVPRPVGALIIATLGVTLLLPIFEPWANGHEVYRTLENYQGVIITGGLILGLLDIIFGRLPKAPKRSSH